MGNDVGQRLRATAWGCLPTSLGRVMHDRLIASGALGGDAVRLYERVPKEVATSALSRALRVALEPHARATLASLVGSLGSSHQPYRHHRAWDKKSIGGDGASLIMDSVMMGLRRLALARIGLGVESN
jgi:hypothetical protein